MLWKYVLVNVIAIADIFNYIELYQLLLNILLKL